MSSREERFVEAWIATHVKPEGYEADDSRAKELATRLASDAEGEGITRDAIEAEIGPLAERMALALQQSTEDAMMAQDGRGGNKSVELPVGEKREMLEEEAERTRRG
jgi:hypothetical protein